MAMNKINASERLKEAAQNEADASYIRKVREAEGDKQRKILNGEGISGQRLAILQGYSTGVESMAHGLGLSSADIVNFVLETQRYDMLSEVGISENAKTIFLDTGSGGPTAAHHVEGQKGVTATDIRNAVRQGTMEAAEVNN
jgi:regulator of protease activity HflC (stomatin/prohibitin superfamily)